LVLNSDGSYTYTLNNDNPAVQALDYTSTPIHDVFTYTLTDSDGESTTTTLTININSMDHEVTVTVPNPRGVEVTEDQMTTGYFSIDAVDGLNSTAALTIAGTVVSKNDLENTGASGHSHVTITTAEGVLTLTGYNPDTGVVSWSYIPSGAKNHDSTDTIFDNIPITLKDADNDTYTANLNIKITDTAPTAISDVTFVANTGTMVSGNVINGDPIAGGKDILGADDPTVVTDVASKYTGAKGTVGTGLEGQYGTLTLLNNGHYDYVIDPAKLALAWEGADLQDVFSYTITDADGNSSTTNLTVTVSADDTAAGITFTPVSLSISGNEGVIVPLGLNGTLLDPDSELAKLEITGLGEHAAFYWGTGNSASLLAASYDSVGDIYTLVGLTAAQVSQLGVIQSSDGSPYTVGVKGYSIELLGGDISSSHDVTLSVDLASVPATGGDDTLLYSGSLLNGLGGTDTVQLRFGEDLDASGIANLSNIERIDLMSVGQNHTLSLSLEDVLGITNVALGGGAKLTILGDTGDMVSLQNNVLGGDNDQWVLSSTSSTEVGAARFDVYTNAYDSTVQVLIQHQIQQHIDN
jgi:VCBS repeat-containing protein